MSGSEILPDEVPGAKIIEWNVEEPVYMKHEDHCKIRGRTETLVVRLVLDLRKAAGEPQFRGQGSGRLEL